MLDTLKKTFLYIFVPVILGSTVLKLTHVLLSGFSEWIPRVLGLLIAAVTSLIIYVVCERQPRK